MSNLLVSMDDRMASMSDLLFNVDGSTTNTTTLSVDVRAC